LATTPTGISAFPAGLARRISPEALLRFGLVPLTVGVCYLLGWHWLKHLTLEMNLRLDALLGIPLERLTAETVMWRGQIYRYEIACTFADVWCGALPLIWNLRKTVGRNVLDALLFGAALIGFNVARLSFSDVLFAAGIAWDIAHHVISGVSYFAVWTWIWRNRSWSWEQPPGTATEPATAI